MDVAPKLQEYVHPDYGMVRVHWRTECGYRGVVPFSFETDLLTPDSEVQALMDWMRCVRLDRSISVSASVSYDEGLPW